MRLLAQRTSHQIDHFSLHEIKTAGDELIFFVSDIAWEFAKKQQGLFGLSSN